VEGKTGVARAGPVHHCSILKTSARVTEKFSVASKLVQRIVIHEQRLGNPVCIETS
jgi:hypothetical protein